MTEEETSSNAFARDASRRAMFKGIGAGAGLGAVAMLAGAGMNASAQTPSAASGSSGGGSLIDKWLKTKKAVLGWEFGSPPMQFKDLSLTVSELNEAMTTREYQLSLA